MKFKFYSLIIVISTMMSTAIYSMAFRECYHTQEKIRNGARIDTDKVKYVKERSLLVTEYNDFNHYQIPYGPHVRHYIDVEDIVGKCRKEQVAQGLPCIPNGVVSIIAAYDYGHAVDIMNSIIVADLKKHYFSHLPAHTMKVALKQHERLTYLKDSHSIGFAPLVIFQDTSADKR